MKLKRTKKPFLFHTRLNLSELTGFRATTLGQLLDIIKTVPGSCIYHHTHRFLQQHQYLSPEPPNDFAYWVSKVLGEDALGEKLASIDIMQYTTIRDIREEIVAVIERYLQENQSSGQKFASPDDAFHFIKSISFVIPTHYMSYDLNEFVDVLSKITIDSIYFHIFEARLRLERGSNDFSYWIEHDMGNRELAARLNRVDLFTNTMEGVRNEIVGILRAATA